MRPRLTYANVMASIAVFVALGGTGYAVTALPKNSVGNRQLKANAVTGAKVRNGSLTSKDLSAATVKALRGAAGPTGAAGPAGAPGVPGANGRDGVARLLTKTGPPSTTITSGAFKLTATVPTAGSYLGIADAPVINLRSSAAIIRCTLGSSNEQVGMLSRTLFLNQLGAVPDSGTITVQRAMTLSAGEQVTLQCSSSGGSPNFEVDDPRLNLVSADSVTTLP